MNSTARLSSHIPVDADTATVSALLAYARLGEFGFPADLRTGINGYRADMQHRVQQLAEHLTGNPSDGFALRIAAGLWATDASPATAPTRQQIDALRAEFGVL